MSILVVENNNIIQDIQEDILWDGLFSKVSKNGAIINFIKENLPEDTIMIIPKSDGNIKKIYKNDEFKMVEWEAIQYYIDYAKGLNKKYILGVLSHIGEEDNNINYLYLPLDDNFFKDGIDYYFPHSDMIPWNERNSSLCWRGGCSGINHTNEDGLTKSLRINFVEKLFKYPNAENVRLSNWWSDEKNIDSRYFGDRIYYKDFLKYKIFFIVDGNVISSNYMWGFASGCVPFLISNSKCWFSNLIEPYVHYIPVNYDLSNLIEQIEYIANNDTVAESIANAALQFSKDFFSSEYQKNYLISSLNLILDKFKFKDNINKKYIQLCNSASDINEHLPILYNLATECESIIELGVRGVISSWALANGLLNNNMKNKKLFLNDLVPCNIEELLKSTKNLDIQITYQWINCLYLEEQVVDMVFIDTWHIYGQLKRELEKFSKFATKYIVMHDTTVDEFQGETIRCGLNAEKQSQESGIPVEEILEGLGRAIIEFLENNPNWVVKKKYTNNNGLTILEKINL